MKIKDIELANISRYRSELMGAAMLFIILFHVLLPRSDMFFGLRRMGNIGVDMFFYLSGIGLWFSWIKRPSLKNFFKRRFLRVYPAWFIVATIFYLSDYLGPHYFSTSLVDLIGDITINWGFWVQDELSFWYIPAIMVFYLFAPFYMKLIIKHPIYRWLPVAMIMWCISVQYVTPLHDTIGHLEIFWSRVPIFFIGINCGEMVRQKKTLDGASIWMVILIFVMALGSSIFLEQQLHGQFPIYIERMLYIPLTVTGVLLLNRVFRRMPKWFNHAFSFVGTLSLEIYLIHLHFVLVYIEPLKWAYWPTFLACVAITLPLAWILHKVIEMTLNKIEK